ncbi:MAG: PilZ domain-containing protein [Candidatus Omnitrophica bacterium]|nr:PilZ domain-containing protein [Candidatus Omnitrophota bacterium]
MWQGVDKRRFPRIKVKCQICIQKHDLLINAFTENIGIGGVCLYTDIKVPLFEDLDVKLFFEKKQLDFKGTVVWVIENKKICGAEKNELGIEFSNIDQQLLISFSQEIEKLTKSMTIS